MVMVVVVVGGEWGVVELGRGVVGEEGEGRGQWRDNNNMANNLVWRDVWLQKKKPRKKKPAHGFMKLHFKGANILDYVSCHYVCVFRGWPRYYAGKM